MQMSKYPAVATLLTLAGTLFSGYLVGIKFFSATCAFGEECPFFLGYPACYFGFALFFGMFVSSAYALATKASTKWPVIVNMVIASLGVLFAGSFTVGEIASWFTAGFHAFGLLGLSTCAYGLVFFVIILVVSMLVRFQTNGTKQTVK
jgi:hypothetical protein